MYQNILKKNLITIGMHIGLWGLVFIWPLFSIDDSSQLNRIVLLNWLPTLCVAFVFYINYLIMVDDFYLKKKRVIFILTNLMLIVFLLFLMKYIFDNYAIKKVFREGIRLREGLGLKNNPRNNRFLSMQFILPMILSIGMSIGLKVSEQWNKNQILLEKSRQSNLNAEIKYLRFQIQPHFLFNTFNNIYSLIDSSPNLAKESIHSLSKMMRYLLHDSSLEKVPLSKEVEFLERYIKLMQLRVTTNLTLEKKFPIINQQINIAPLILVSFIENAFKHGVDAVLPSYINISLTIENNCIYYKVENSFFPENNNETDSGIGLENLSKRLNLLYSNKFNIIKNVSTNSYKIELIIYLDDD